LATVRSATIAPANPTGPSEPGPAPNAARMASGPAKVSGAFTCGSFSALIAFTS
jgi:hypothetical protein